MWNTNECHRNDQRWPWCKWEAIFKDVQRLLKTFECGKGVRILNPRSLFGPYSGRPSTVFHHAGGAVMEGHLRLTLTVKGHGKHISSSCRVHEWLLTYTERAGPTHQSPLRIVTFGINTYFLRSFLPILRKNDNKLVAALELPVWNEILIFSVFVTACPDNCYHVCLFFKNTKQTGLWTVEVASEKQTENWVFTVFLWLSNFWEVHSHHTLQQTNSGKQNKTLL